MTTPAFATKTFPAQDALTSAIRARSELDAWEVDFGIPANRPKAQHIWVDENVSDWTQEVYTTGLDSRRETFRLAIYIYSRQSGATAIEIRDEISTAAGIVSEVIGSDAFLGGVVLLAQIVAADYEGAFADPEGRSREGVLKLQVECQGFLA